MSDSESITELAGEAAGGCAPWRADRQSAWPRAPVELDARRSSEDRTGETAALRPAVTLDGTPIRIMLNIADPAELNGLDPPSATGIGLVRTEFLFHDRANSPTKSSNTRSTAVSSNGRGTDR